MKKLLSLLTVTTMIMACSKTPKNLEPMLGGDKDTHGCLTAAGQSYSFLKKACVQVFDIAEIKLTDPANDTLAVYAILSEDKMFAEVFAADLPENTILESVKGGYVSKDGKIRLMKKANGWKIQK